MNITQALTEIANKTTTTALAAKQAISDKTRIIEFANYITEQCKEGTNQQTLEQAYGKEPIETILKFNKQKAAEQDFIVMNKCIENDMNKINKNTNA